MAYRSLREFMAKLEAAGELVRVREPVSTVLEITEIQRRLLATGGPAVLFENPIRADGEASSIPALANLFGTVKRVAMGVTLEGKERTTASELRAVGELLAFLRQPEPPRGLKDAMEMLPLARTVMGMRPNVRKTAPVQEVIWKGDQIDLSKLPIQGCWPGEPAPLITWPLVVTKGPSTSREDDYNLGIYRMQVIGPDRTIMRWLAHRGGAQHHRRWKAEGKREPLPAYYMDHDARIKKLDEQGLEAMGLFPTLGVLYEELLKHDIAAVKALFTGFNRWLDEDWGVAYRNRIFGAPYISLVDLPWACSELEWAIVQRPHQWFAFGPLWPDGGEAAQARGSGGR